MARTLFGPGLNGEIARSIQDQLAKAGCYTGRVDGKYGDRTAVALRSFQRAKRLPESDCIDEGSWRALMERDPPSLALRALGLTAAIEGHGYGLALGNWDKAWLTWGIIGFTLKHGQVRAILLEILRAAQQRLEQAFESRAAELVAVMQDPDDEVRLRWANSITVGHGIAEPWRIGFARLGTFAEVREIQERHALDNYYNPGAVLARQLGFRSELANALFFDIQVQNGGLRQAARDAIDAARAKGTLSESELRLIVADAVANAARDEFREDVRRRKRTIAMGQGMVHGLNLVLENWGIGEYPSL